MFFFTLIKQIKRLVWHKNCVVWAFSNLLWKNENYGWVSVQAKYEWAGVWKPGILPRNIWSELPPSAGWWEGGQSCNKEVRWEQQCSSAQVCSQLQPVFQCESGGGESGDGRGAERAVMIVRSGYSTSGSGEGRHLIRSCPSWARGADSERQWQWVLLCVLTAWEEPPPMNWPSEWQLTTGKVTRRAVLAKMTWFSYLK